MAGYDASKDNLLQVVATRKIGKSEYRIALYRYDQGAPKLALEILFGRAKNPGVTESRPVSGRMTEDLWKFLSENSQSIREAFENHTATVSTPAPVATAASTANSVFRGLKASK